MRRLTFAAALLATALVTTTATAQQILIDQGARVDGLWCFPSAINPKHYYYIPSTARLVTNDAGTPSFSYLRYVINRPSAEAGAQGITQAEGGGILHFLVTYDTPPELIRTAEQGLRRMNPDEDEVSLRGPVIFKEGRYALISSIINPAGEEEPHVLASGNAPVLEGSQLALSFDLPPDRATLLLESLKMATPDISLIFEMTVVGLSDAFDADLVIRWDSVHNHEAFGVGFDIPTQYVGFSGEIGNIVDELIESKAIELRTRGANPNLEALLDKVHTQLLDLMFEPIPIEQEQEKKEEGGGGLPVGGLLGALGGSGSEKNEYGRRPVPFVGVSLGYQTKKVKKSGETVMSLNHQAPVERVTTIGFNVGNLWSRYEDDPKIFKTVNLADPAFQQREIHVGIDGAILPEFDSYINSVTTTLRKRHQNGKTTLQEIVVDRETFNATQNNFRMIYGWNGDDDRTAWLEYEYQTRWSFKGGGIYETPWTRSDANMIDLYAPYKRKVVRVMGDHASLAEQGIRAIIVYVDYPFFEGRKKDKIRLRADQPIEDKNLEITLPLDVNDYHYRVVWIPTAGDRVEAEGTDSTGILFIDEPPASGATEGEQALRRETPTRLAGGIP